MAILIIITIISILIAIYCAINKKKIDTHISIENNKLLEENNRLESLKKEISESLNKISKEHSTMVFENNQLQSTIDERKHHLATVQETIDSTLKNQKELSQQAFENYCEILNNKYKETEEEYDTLIETLKNSYSNLQLNLMREADECRSDLDKIRATRVSAMEAQLKEKEIKEQLSFYCLRPSQSDLDDVKKLERIKPDLHNPRILSMLIWSTYFQKPMTSLCNNVLGTDTITGIYKITNQKDNMCYIGQAVDVSKRWKDHAKCGLGIDTPASNKLYKAMIQDGIWNFSWELLEKCPRENLDEKEKFYIELYQSYEFGYNSNAGIGKK